MMSSWDQTFCSFCQEINWINDGDLEDITKPDIEGVCCHACDKVYLRFDRKELELMYGCEVEEYGKKLEDVVFTEYGRKNPSDPYKPFYRKK